MAADLQTYIQAFTGTFGDPQPLVSAHPTLDIIENWMSGHKIVDENYTDVQIVDAIVGFLMAAIRSNTGVEVELDFVDRDVVRFFALKPLLAETVEFIFDEGTATETITEIVGTNDSDPSLEEYQAWLHELRNILLRIAARHGGIREFSLGYSPMR